LTFQILHKLTFYTTFMKRFCLFVCPCTSVNIETFSFISRTL